MTISRCCPSLRELHRASKRGKTCLLPQEALYLQGKSTKAFSSFVDEVTDENGNVYIVINDLLIQKGCKKFRLLRKRQLNKKREATWAPVKPKKARVPLGDLSAVTRSLDFSDEKVEASRVSPT